MMPTTSNRICLEDFLRKHNIPIKDFIDANSETVSKHTRGYINGVPKLMSFRSSITIQNDIKLGILSQSTDIYLERLFDRGIDWSICRKHRWSHLNRKWCDMIGSYRSKNLNVEFIWLSPDNYKSEGKKAISALFQEANHFDPENIKGIK